MRIRKTVLVAAIVCMNCCRPESESENSDSGSPKGIKNTSSDPATSGKISSRGEESTGAELEEALDGFDIGEPMSDAELEQFSKLMLKLVLMDPERAIQMMREWGDFSPEGLKEYLFEEIVRTATPETTRHLAAEVLANRSKSNSDRGNAKALLKAIAHQGKEEDLLPQLRTFFSQNPGMDFVSTFFEAVSPLRSQSLLDMLPQLGIHGRSALDAKRSIAFGLRFDEPLLSLQIAADIDSAYTGGFYGELFREWMLRDRESAKVELLKLEPDQLRIALSNGGLVQLISMDKELVDMTISQIPLTDAYSSVFKSIISKLSQEDAFLLLEGFPPGEARRDLVESALGNTSPSDSQGVSGFLDDVPVGLRQDASAVLIRKLALNNPTEALAFINSSSDPSLRSDLFGSMVEATSMRSAESAAELFDQNSQLFSDAGKRLEVASTIAGNWANYDVNSALTWANSLPAEEKAESSGSVFKVWVRTDPIAFSTWLQDQPPSAIRNSGIRVLIPEIESSSPDAANEWRSLLSDDSEN